MTAKRQRLCDKPPAVGDTFTRYCRDTHCDFVYEITEVRGPRDFTCKMVGISRVREDGQ